MAGDRRTRRGSRAQEFGRLHPRLTGMVAALVLAGITATCAFQIRHGTYLGGGWLVAAVAGMAAGVAMPAALIGSVRYRLMGYGLRITVTLLGAGLAWSATVPFPVGRYGSVQAFLNVLHAIGLGFSAVACAELIALVAFLVLHPGSLPSRAELRWQLRRRERTIFHGWPGWVLAGAVAGFVAGFSLAVAAGSHTRGAASAAAGILILVALPALAVAVAVILYRLYRRYRSRRLAALAPGLRGNGPGDWRRPDPAG